MPLRRYSGVFDPADLALLQKVFDRLCRERRLALKDKEQRATLAQEVVSVFERGVVDEAELIQVLSKRRRKR